MQRVIITQMLRDRHAGCCITSVIEVWVFHGLIFETSFTFLTTNNCIGLESFLIIKPFTFNITFTFQGNINELERCTLPEIIAGINKFINTTIETTLFSQLSRTQPIYKSIKIKFISLIQYNHSSKSTECITTMGFTKRYTRYTAFISLTRLDEISYPLSKFLIFDV